jgi:signal transduction histidine kinase
MTFQEILDQAIAMLQGRGRMISRTLQRRFTLDEVALNDLKDERLHAHPEIQDDAGRGLVWSGHASTAVPDGVGWRLKGSLGAKASGRAAEDRRGGTDAVTWSARSTRLLVTALIVGVAYYAGAWVGFTTAFPGPGSARRHLFWPPNVILLAGLLVTPPRWWWPCSLTAFAAHLLAHAQLGMAPAVMALPVQFAGNVLQAVLAACTLRRLSDPPWRVDTLRSMLAVIAVAGVAAPALVSALVIHVYVWAGWMLDYASAWRVRFLANAVSTITLAPLLLTVAGHGLRGLRDVAPWRVAEFVAVLVGLLAVGTLVSRSATSAAQLPLLYAPLPFLLWAAVRFGPSGLSIALVATLLLFVGEPFGGPSVSSVPADNVITLAVFLVAIAIPLLLLSALVQERRQAQEQLSLLQTITLEVAAADDLSSALKVVICRVCKTTGWVIGQAWIPRHDGTVLECSPAWFSMATGLEPFRQASEATTFLPGVGLPGRVWSAKQPSWIQDVTMDLNFPRVQVAGALGLKAALGIPIQSGDEVLAVLEFFMREPRREDARLVNVITAVAAQLDLVMARKRAEQIRREHEAVLRANYDRIQDLTGKLITAQEAERSRIASELHDDVNQQLAGLSIALSHVKRRLHDGGNTTVQEELTRLQQRTMDLANVIRSLSHALHPGVLRHAGLVAALQGYCAEFGRQHAIEVTLSAANGVHGIPPDVALCLYRVAQEALRNTAAHAGARQVHVTLSGTADGLELVIADDGQGFNLAQAQHRGGLGLISLDERVRLVGGSLTINAQVTRGTEVRVQVPLRGTQ